MKSLVFQSVIRYQLPCVTACPQISKGLGAAELRFCDSKFSAVNPVAFNAWNIVNTDSQIALCPISLVLFEWALMTSLKEFDHVQWELLGLNW